MDQHAQRFISLADRLAHHAEHAPDRRALVCDGQALTYAALVRKARAVARRLQALKPGATRVGILSQNNPEIVIVIAACQMAGITVVPLPGLVAPDALAQMVADAGITVLFHDERHAEKASDARGGLDSAALIELSALDGWVEGAPCFVQPGIEPNQLSDLIYSSGTTGNPKGILQTFGGRSATCVSLARLGVTDGTGVLNTVGLSSNFAFGGLLLALWWGGTCFMMRKFSGVDAVAILSRERIGLAWLVPATLLRIMEDSGFGPAVAGKSCVKLCAGAPLSDVQKQAVLQTWPGPFYDLYGQTETGTVSLLAIHSAPPDKRGSVGQLLPTSVVRILDETGRVLPDDAVGEIAAHTTTMMSGYHQRDDANATIYWRDEDGRAFVRTGDVGRLDDDGYLWLSDRKKDMIISGGFNVYSVDIERVLQDHPAVFEAAIVGFPSVRWGETPVAFVTLRPTASAAEEELRSWTNTRVGAVQRLAMVRILAALPNGAMGKILKRELREAYAPTIGVLP